MKPYHVNNCGAAIHFGIPATVYTILCFNVVHTTVEYLNSNVSIGHLLQHILKPIVFCARSRPTTPKTFVWRREYCLL